MAANIALTDGGFNGSVSSLDCSCSSAMVLCVVVSSTSDCAIPVAIVCADSLSGLSVAVAYLISLCVHAVNIGVVSTVAADSLKVMS